MNKMVKITKEMRNSLETYRLKNNLTKSAFSEMLSPNKVFLHTFAKQTMVQSKTWARIQKVMAKGHSMAASSSNHKTREAVLKMWSDTTLQQTADVLKMSKSTIQRLKDGELSDDTIQKLGIRLKELNSTEKKAHSNGLLTQNGAPKNGMVKTASKNGKAKLSCVRPAVQAKVAKVQLLTELGTNKYNKDEERYILEALSKM